MSTIEFVEYLTFEPFYHFGSKCTLLRSTCPFSPVPPFRAASQARSPRSPFFVGPKSSCSIGQDSERRAGRGTAHPRASRRRSQRRVFSQSHSFRMAGQMPERAGLPIVGKQGPLCVQCACYSHDVRIATHKRHKRHACARPPAGRSSRAANLP